VLRRSRALRWPTALAALLLSGAITFLASALLFPIATQWGTFLHSAGPLLVGLIVATALGCDALMARVSVGRGWAQVNVILTPIALLAVTLPLLGLQLLTVSRNADRLEARMAAVAAALLDRAAAAGDGSPIVVTDHPMWLATATGARAIVLPHEPIATVVDLARTFGAGWLLVFDDAGRYPAELLADGSAGCLVGPPASVGLLGDEALLVRLAPRCTGS